MTAVELLDIDRLTAWLDDQGIEAGLPLAIEPLVGGTSNAMFKVERGDGRWVLRRPSKVAIERANEGMRREFRILAALGQTDVPHPSVVALCDDQAVLGCTFYLMDQVEGINPVGLPAAFDDDRRRAEVAFSLVDGLARLHDVDWRAVGLGDLGNPEQFHERQVDRWSKQLASYEGRELPGIDEVMRWLEVNIPANVTASLMHGDYHMLNTLIAPDPPGRLVAIVDWETATIGDPLLDLAGFCEIWCSAHSDGWPSREELVERYRTQRRLEVIGSLTYYQVLYNFRLAVLIEGIYQRALRDSTKVVRHDMGDYALRNAARAHELIATK